MFKRNITGGLVWQISV